MKLMHIVFISFTFPFILRADLKNDLVRLQQSLHKLSTLLPKKETIPPETETFIPAGALPSTLPDIEDWLKQVVVLYQKSPLNFAQKISQGELNTIRDMLKKYFKQVVDKAKGDDSDIEINDSILGFIRIPLEERKEQEGLFLDQSYFKVLTGYIKPQSGAPRYDDVNKLTVKYIDSITKQDFSKPLEEINKTVSSFATQIPDLPKKTVAERAAIYSKMKQALEKMRILMLPRIGDAQKVTQTVAELRQDFENVMQKDQNFLTQQYTALQNDQKIKDIQNKFNVSSAGKPSDQVAILRIGMQNQTKKRMNTLIYQKSPQQFQQMLQACQDSRAIVNATSKDVTKLMTQQDADVLCGYIDTVASIRSQAENLATWSDASKVGGYSKQEAEAAYQGIDGLAKRANDSLEIVPSQLQVLIEKAQGVIASRLSMFENEYVQAIQAAVDAAGTKQEGSHQYNLALAAALTPCKILEAIYKYKKTEMPDKVKKQCKAIKAAMKE